MKHTLKSKIYSITLGSIMAISVMAPNPAAAQEPILGQLMLVGFNFCPRSWTPANGQLLATENLFAMI